MSATEPRPKLLPIPELQFEVTAPGADNAIDSGSDPDSDVESQTRDDHVLQVIFDPATRGNHRRKSSLVNIENNHPSPSSCFVHALLETQTKTNPAGSGSSTSAAAPVPPTKKFFDHAHRTPEKPVEERKLGDCGAFAAMTKGQLSDMVLGVRELSKHLASMCIHIKAKSVFVLTKAYDKSMAGYTKTLVKWLLEKKFFVYVEDRLEKDPQFDAKGVVGDNETFKRRLRFWTAETCATKPHAFDFVITLGGDGTVLYASSLFQKVVPPVLAFSLGSLGFLTKFDFEQHESLLTNIVNEGVTIGLRLRFQGTIMRMVDKEKPREERDLRHEILSNEETNTHEPGESFVILNEIVVDRGPNPTLSTTELYGDDMFLTSIAADGVCIATPTGSTAYSLAAGGSLVHPELPGMLISAICAHSLTFRPIILPDSMVLRVGVPFGARTTSWVSFDGRNRTELRQGDYVSVVASRFPFPVVQSKRDNKDWFDSLRRTMNWGTRTPQKAYS